MGQVRLEAMPASGGSYCWGMKDEEYMADFCLVSRRTLEEPEYSLFKYHFLLGADWKLCCQKLQLDRGNFFHGVYRIEQKLGRIFRELEPYPLFPVSEYFHGPLKGATSCLVPPVVPIRPAWRKNIPLPNQKSA